MRRALLALVVVVLLSVAGFIALPVFESRTLGKQLVQDVEALRARTLMRATPPQEPIHENGFLCLSGMLKVTPRDLAPFDSLDSASPLAPFLRGEQPVSALPEDVKKKLHDLEPWGDNLRACGSSRQLRYVSGVEPWDPVDHLLHVSIALSQLTVIQARADLQAGKAVEASLRCQATLAAGFDMTHLSSAGVVAALGLARQTLPVCAAALNALPPEVRVDAAQTWMQLLPRLVSIRELLETERVDIAVRNFGPISGAAGLPPTPPEIFETSAVDRFFERRLWPRWDRTFRKLIEESDAKERAALAKEIDALTGADSGPPMMPVTFDVALQERRLADLTTISLAYTWLAGGAAGTPPAGERTADALVLPLETPVTIPLNK